jgi:hypothetical protein
LGFRLAGRNGTHSHDLLKLSSQEIKERKRNSAISGYTRALLSFECFNVMAEFASQV